MSSFINMNTPQYQTMSRTNVSHGKRSYAWCDACGTLLLGGSCSRCGKAGRRFEVNSPGDIRPCMGESNVILRDLFTEAFGTFAPFEGRALFFNKIPGEDRADEIVAHGEVIGVLMFDVVAGRLRIELRQPGADLLADAAEKNIVTFGGPSGHLKGKNLPGDAVIGAVGDFRAGDPLILKRGTKTGPGIALADSDVFRKADRAFKVRDLNTWTARPVSPPSGRTAFIEANREHLSALESKAVSDIRSFAKGKGKPVTVSFSGGKDSLAAYGLASKAMGDVELLFIDTGIEFPETVAYVGRFAEDRDETLHTARAGNAFWDNVDDFGPPAKDFRWCCKVCKLGPISELIAERYPKGTITVEGNRALESFSRSKLGFVSRNPFVPNQVNLNPLKDWISAEVWGYIWMRGFAYNPLYDRDFERIGCYLCASCPSGEWSNVERTHPELHSGWEERLHGYAEAQGLPPEYVRMGFWRWKVLPPKMVRLAEGLDLKTEPSSGRRLGVTMTKGASPCAAGGYSVEAVATVPRNRDFSYVADALVTIGDVKYSAEFETAVLSTPRGRAKVFGGGQISVTAGSRDDAAGLFERTVKSLLRAQLCTRCGICAKSCPRKAIVIDGGMRVDPRRCDHCGICERSCMVVHYYDKMAVTGPGAPPGGAEASAKASRKV